MFSLNLYSKFMVKKLNFLFFIWIGNFMCLLYLYYWLRYYYVNRIYRSNIWIYLFLFKRLVDILMLFYF